MLIMNNFDSPIIPTEFLERKARSNHSIQPGSISTSKPAGETPKSIRRVYKFDNLIEKGITGKGQNIAIVVAFHYPTAEKDLKIFSKQFGLPSPKLKVHFATGVQPPVDSGWALEAAIDIQWAHALAPCATIHLVEAASDLIGDLLQAVDVASNIAEVVSMSWGDGENAVQPFLDFHFQKPGVVYLASSGNIGGVTQWPATSPSVVAVGGTRLNRDINGKFISETGWSGSGGGRSVFFAEPDYQNDIETINTAGRRVVPDVSFVADPTTGVAIFTTTPTPDAQTGWLVAGGTSVSAPCWAGIIALADQIRRTPFSFSNIHDALYNLARNRGLYARNYRDITVGTAGTFSCLPGYDLVTGLGSPRVKNLVKALGKLGSKKKHDNESSS
jgi:subtilase family serine protease